MCSWHLHLFRFCFALFKFSLVFIIIILSFLCSFNAVWLGLLIVFFFLFFFHFFVCLFVCLFYFICVCVCVWGFFFRCCFVCCCRLHQWTLKRTRFCRCKWTGSSAFFQKTNKLHVFNITYCKWSVCLNLILI